MQNSMVMFTFSTEKPFLGKSAPKIQSCLFKVKFGTRSNPKKAECNGVVQFLPENT